MAENEVERDPQCVAVSGAIRRGGGLGGPPAAAWFLAGLALLTCAPAGAMSTESEQYAEALRLAPRLDHGAQLFEMCAACHGRDGHGAADGSVPAIAGQSVPVLVNQIIEFRFDARHNIRVQGFIDHHPLTPQDLADVASYVSSLPPRQPPAGHSSPLAAHGEAVFEQQCSGCHGPHAEGDPATRTPRLAGQHPRYLAEQLRDAAKGSRPSMEPDHARLLGRLSSADIEAVSQYLGALPPGAPERAAPARGAISSTAPAAFSAAFRP